MNKNILKAKLTLVFCYVTTVAFTQLDFLSQAGDTATAVALYNDYAVIGNPNGINSNGVKTGTASLYQRDETSGEFLKIKDLVPVYLNPTGGSPVGVNDITNNSLYGFSVAMNDSVIAIGAPGAANYGTVVLFKKNVNGFFVYEGRIENDGEPFRSYFRHERQQYGASLDFNDRQLVIGAPVRDELNGSTLIRGDVGAVDLAEPNETGKYEITNSFYAEETKVNSRFGASLAFEDLNLFIGSPNEFVSKGAVHFFSLSLDGWQSRQVFNNSDDDVHLGFGEKIKLQGSQLIVNSERANGAVYSFLIDGNDITETQILTFPSGDFNVFYGSAIALSNDRLLVGAKEVSSPQSEAGTVFFYEKDENGTWQLKEEYVEVNKDRDRMFGSFLAMNENYVVMGSVVPSFYETCKVYGDTITSVTCDRFSFNGEFYYQSGDYEVNVGEAEDGCDSIVLLQVEINQSFDTAYVVDKTCDFYLLPDGNVAREEGVYKISLSSSTGCDSIFNIDIKEIKKTESKLDTIVVCEKGYKWPQNGMTYTESGNYTDTILPAKGNECAVINRLNLIFGTFLQIDSVETCGSYKWPTDGKEYTQEGTYKIAEQSKITGCDSTHWLVLTLREIDTTLTYNAPNPDFPIATIGSPYKIFANETEAFNYTLIEQENLNSITSNNFGRFDIEEQGNYAIIVEYGTCVDTTEFANVVITGIYNSKENDFSLYPSPANSSLVLSSDFNGDYQILSVSGILLANGKKTTIEKSIDLSGLNTGAYFLRFNGQVSKFIKL